MAGNSQTPLSDAIALCVSENTRARYEEFIRVFLVSKMGVIASGPQREPGTYKAGKDEFGVAIGGTPDGRKMVLACADRAVFVQRYSRPFNAEVDALALLNIAIANPDCEGILINSATSEHSIVIERARVAALLSSPPKRLIGKKPWWKFWASE